ncbi:hypothetical protein ZHAS_00004276 [Anopheles sinensis]|uniref:Uncharacterized protein n=1 Tax=Anopheles sinensis TaxID=74873 RepID=A0A084VGH4_ANOSI|nr:hypothetical protein ZHAS_00004276 [Anopheles sinensis]
MQQTKRLHPNICCTFQGELKGLTKAEALGLPEGNLHNIQADNSSSSRNGTPWPQRFNADVPV